MVARFADASFAVEERFAVASLRFAAFRFAIFSLQGERAVRCGAVRRDDAGAGPDALRCVASAACLV